MLRALLTISATLFLFQGFAQCQTLNDRGPGLSDSETLSSYLNSPEPETSLSSGNALPTSEQSYRTCRCEYDTFTGSCLFSDGSTTNYLDDYLTNGAGDQSEKCQNYCTAHAMGRGNCAPFVMTNTGNPTNVNFENPCTYVGDESGGTCIRPDGSAHEGDADSCKTQCSSIPGVNAQELLILNQPPERVARLAANQGDGKSCKVRYDCAENTCIISNGVDKDVSVALPADLKTDAYGACVLLAAKSATYAKVRKEQCGGNLLENEKINENLCKNELPLVSTIKKNTTSICTGQANFERLVNANGSVNNNGGLLFQDFLDTQIKYCSIRQGDKEQYGIAPRWVLYPATGTERERLLDLTNAADQLWLAEKMQKLLNQKPTQEFPLSSIQSGDCVIFHTVISTTYDGTPGAAHSINVCANDKGHYCIKDPNCRDYANGTVATANDPCNANIKWIPQNCNCFTNNPNLFCKPLSEEQLKKLKAEGKPAQQVILCEKLGYWCNGKESQYTEFKEVWATDTIPPKAPSLPAPNSSRSE